MSILNYLVEGDIDEAVARKLILYTGHEVGASYGKRGFSYIQNKIGSFNKSAIDICYFALVDFMDTNLPCPGAVLSTWLPHRSQKMLFRVAVREVESWLLADRDNLASFLNVSQTRMPADPENSDDPKRTLVNIARHSSTKSIRDSLVPDQGSTAQVGKLYNSEMSRFVNDHWRPEIARNNANSLEKCLHRLEEFDQLIY